MLLFFITAKNTIFNIAPIEVIDKNKQVYFRKNLGKTKNDLSAPEGTGEL